MKTTDELLAYFDDNVTAHLTSEEDTRLRQFIELVKADAHLAGELAGLTEAAEIAKKHKGKSEQKRKERGLKLSNLTFESANSVRDEERGEDIASYEISKSILIARNAKALAAKEGK